jgi:hypothetical protein
MMLSLLLPFLILAQDPSAGTTQDTTQPLSSLSFISKRFEYHWDRIISLDFSVDDFKVKTIFFNKRELNKSFLKGAQFGTRAKVEVVNMSNKSKNPGFAVAIFDEKDNLLGVASGGSKIGVVKPGKTETFDLNFYQVKERLMRGSYFVISVELIN